MASSHPATSPNVVFGMSLVTSFAFDLANCMTPRPPPPWTWFIRKTNSRMISANGRIVISSEPMRLGFGTSTFSFSISPALICLLTASTRPTCWSVTQKATTFLSSSRVARISWSLSTNVISLTAPVEMFSSICDVEISSYPPLGVRNCRASRTPTTATTIHSHGPLNMRFTVFSRTTSSELLTVQAGA